LEYHFLLARDLGFVATEIHEQVSSQVVEIKRMLVSLIQKLRAER